MRCLLAVLLVAASPAPARAQNGADIDLQGFRPAMDSRGFVTVNASNVLEPGQLSLGLVTTWGRGLLRFEQGDNRYEVQHMITPTLVGAVGLGLLGLDLEIGGALPFTIMSGDRAPDSDGATPGDPNDDASYRFDGQGLADASLHLKWRLRPGGSGIGLALVGSLTLPTASASDRWLGDRSTVPQLVAVADHRAGRLALAANAGVRWRGAGERFSDDQPAGMAPLTRGVVESGSAVPFGVAVSYAVVPERFDLLAELFGAAPLAGENLFPLEALGGIKLYLAKSSFLSFGAGAGLLGDRGGNPDARAFLAIVFEPRSAAVEGGRIADPAPPVLARAPDGDRDDDGIRDSDDGCPDVPEDHDGFQDRDGCPELDNDRDRIADADDLCIDRPEVYNTVEDEDGCPDHGPVIEREGEIELLEVIQFEFDSAVIRPESHAILRAVAMTIQLNPSIELVEIRGHTDERGSADYNLDLSHRRARSVLDFLVGEGVPPDHLTSRGHGETMPLIRESNERAWTANRRVEFLIAR